MQAVAFSLWQIVIYTTVISCVDMAPSRDNTLSMKRGHFAINHQPKNKLIIEKLRGQSDIDDKKDDLDLSSAYDLDLFSPDAAGLSSLTDQQFLAKPQFHDPRVVFSARKPTTSPWTPSIDPLSSDTPLLLNFQTDETHFRNKHRRRRHKGLDKPGHSDRHPSRGKRHTRAGRIMAACDSVTEWVANVTSEDIHGNQVNILQEIDIGGARVNQYFYETWCVATPGGGPCQCRGIDRGRYESRCVERFTWAYAKVQNSQGDRGWTYIKVRAACNCAIEQREHTA